MADSQRYGFCKKAHRRHQHVGPPDVERLQNAADQPHVVIARQPEHARCPSGCARRNAQISAELWTRLAWLSTTPFGVPVEPEVYCRNASVSPWTSGMVQSVCHFPRHLARGQPSKLLQVRRFVDQRHHSVEHQVGRQRHPGLGIVGNGLDAVQRAIPPGRVDRHGNHPGVQAPEERRDELQPRRIQQQRPLAHQVVRFQPRPDRPGLAVQLPIASDGPARSRRRPDR